MAATIAGAAVARLGQLSIGTNAGLRNAAPEQSIA
jgi:hypothetical protein